MEKLEVKTITSPDDPKIDAVHALYTKCFPLEEERVPIETFH